MKVATKKVKSLDKIKPKKAVIKKKQQSEEIPKLPKVVKKTKQSKVEKQPKKKVAKKLQKQDLEGLKDIDPEFYDFLKKNDKELLDFNLMDSDDDDDEEEEEEQQKEDAAEDSEEDDAKYHKPSNDLAVASDESDFEGDDDDEETAGAGGAQKITLNMLRQWELELAKPNVSIEAVRQVIQAFNSALASISADAEGEQANAAAYKVVGAATFNGVIQLCVLHLQPAIIKVLGVKPNSSLPLHKHKKWVKVRGCLRYYLGDLIRLVEQVSSSNILNVLLKHLHQMAGMVAPFSSLGKTILKRLIVLWATGDETVRVLAFLCILKITRKQQVSCI